MMEIPSPTQQLSFLDHVQRLFDEGEFSATYKFALLQTITELAIEHGDDSGESLELSHELIADKFLEIYWPQVAPYSRDGVTAVLIQNSGRQAATVTLLQELRGRHGTLPKARASLDWVKALRKTVALLKAMPLWRLQILRREKVSFLYEPASETAIRLLPGVMFNLRRFHGLLHQLTRHAWIQLLHANPLNAPVLGTGSDLEQLLFGVDRANLSAARPILNTIQKGQCFYCHQSLQENGEVDHFIPWSRYPRNLGENFVLAHRRCNADKRDLLPAPIHLANWQERNRTHGAYLIEQLGARFVCDGLAMRRVAYWAYRQAYATSSQCWSGVGQTGPLSSDYQYLLAGQGH
ncbi:HNH endonuclease [Herbaspirillum sp. RU 5E]|jgi:hypothetical protein|nr:HNH endonuclease [Herbaspirillum sp. RU 5E]